MHPQYWVEDLLGTRAKVRILRLLCTQPGRWWTEREIASAISMSPNTVSLAARDLLAAGVLSLQRLGKSNGLRFRPDQGLARPVQRLFAAERSTFERMSQEIARALPAGVEGYVFGSTARGEATLASDVDIAIVAKNRAVADEAVGRAIAAASTVFPVPPRIIGFERREFKTRPSALVTSILREGKVFGSSEADF